MSEVRRVGQEARESVAHTVAASFADDPIWQWIYDTERTIPIETGIVLARVLVARSTPGDVIHSIADEGAIALWTAPSESSSSENEKLRDDQAKPFTSAFAKQLGDRITITGTLSAAMAEHRPQESHWYLGILGAHPDRQSQGLGSKVLGAMLAESDALGLPTFLESSNPRNYGFYQRHGYVERGELTVEGSPPLLGFWRPQH
jgi:GNAT superfamily N-acetyltransferase